VRFGRGPPPFQGQVRERLGRLQLEAVCADRRSADRSRQACSSPRAKGVSETPGHHHPRERHLRVRRDVGPSGRDLRTAPVGRDGFLQSQRRLGGRALQRRGAIVPGLQTHVRSCSLAARPVEEPAATVAAPARMFNPPGCPVNARPLPLHQGKPCFVGSTPIVDSRPTEAYAQTRHRSQQTNSAATVPSTTNRSDSGTRA
jgi:hypothetical protein